MRVALSIIGLLSVSACSGHDSETDLKTIVNEADRAEITATAHDAEDALDREMIGFWRTTVFNRGAWVDLIWVVGYSHAWHVVTAYADEDLTIPLLRWDVLRRYLLDQPSTEIAGATNMRWDDRAAQLLAFVDDPALFESVGIDDCSLQPGVPVDLSLDNCGAPLFPFHDCQLLDFVELDAGLMTFGDPTQGDRCVQRPTRREAWSFRKVRLDFELLDRLFGSPWNP